MLQIKNNILEKTDINLLQIKRGGIFHQINTFYIVKKRLLHFRLIGFIKYLNTVLIGKTSGTGQIFIAAKGFMVKNPLAGVGIKMVQLMYGAGTDAGTQNKRDPQCLEEFFFQIGGLYKKGIVVA